MHVATRALRLALAIGLGVGCFATAGSAQRMRHGQKPSVTVPGVRLSESQQTRISHSRRQTQAQVRAIQRNPRLSAAEKQRRIAATRRRGHEQVMGHLTPRQRQQFSAAYREHARVAGYRGKPHARTTTPQRQHQQRSTRRTHRSY